MLPKSEHPILSIVIPSTKKKVSFRPFLVKEEKILLMAKTSGEPTDILQAVKQIVQNCSLEKGFKVNQLTIFDLEYLFLKIRAQSVGNMVPLAFQDQEDMKEYKFNVDLDKIEVVFPENISNKVEISDKLGLIMKYPSAALYDDKKFLGMKEGAMFELIVRCIDKVYDDKGMYEAATCEPKEIEEFLDNLDIKSFQKVQEFMTSTPKMQHIIEYKNSNGTPRKIELTSLSDFFTLT
jgi:hypothetical protein